MKKEKRFEIAYQEGGFMGAKTIYVDKETGVNYLFMAGADGFLNMKKSLKTDCLTV